MPAKLLDLLSAWRTEASDPCGMPETKRRERPVFDEVAAEVVAALNNGRAPVDAADRAKTLLVLAEQSSAAVNSNWPEDSRLHFTLQSLDPVLLLTLSFRTQARFFVFGRPGRDNEPNGAWQEVGSDERSTLQPTPRLIYHLYPLRRGAPGTARFLARSDFFGCAGSAGIGYRVLSWGPNFYSLQTEVEQDGAFGMDQAADGGRPSRKDPFHPIGDLRTAGDRLTLPYCWFSALDWWDNPSLCAEDTYDLRGDEAVFVSRRFNRPELVPLAKAYEYQRSHDLPAMLGYFASEELARLFLRHPPELADASSPQVRWLGSGRARIQLEQSARFMEERRRDGWVITGFKALP